ncbi:MAG: hypothetical protein Q7R90_03975 [bacterium]|nr:hypothetical protein [bacterium]
MTAPNTGTELEVALKERFDKLPKVVQDAITSADVEKRMRELADTSKLHVDQWQSLENEVMLTLLGVQPIGNLEKNIQNEVVVSSEVAKSLTDAVSKIVFEPIREQLERELAHPDAKAAEVSGVEAARTQILGNEDKPAAPAVPAVLPATPPAEPPSAKIARAPVSESYKAGETSAARKSVHDDPYREPPQ